MDIALPKIEYLCPKHFGQVEFLQVNNFQANKKDQKLFYCSDCAEQDASFQFSNYQQMKHVLQSGSDQILTKWPPVNDNQLLIQLNEQSKGKDEKESIVAQIESYFRDLKQDIMKELDFCQKAIIHQAQELVQTYDKTQVLKKYQQLSKVNELKAILLNNKTDIQEKEMQYKVLIEDIQAQKKAITEQLASLLHSNQKAIYNSESALSIKESILKSIRSISFFQSANIKQENNNNGRIPLDVSLFTTNYAGGNKYTEITKNNNNQYQLTIKEESVYYLNTVSSIILQNQTKYIFRIQIQDMQQSNDCYIGLINDCNINIDAGYDDQMSCYLYQEGKYLYNDFRQTSGISNLIKGYEFRLSENGEIEIRVSINDSILELLDYPNYHSKIALSDQYKSNLNINKDFRLYLGFSYQNNKAILKEAFTIDTFQQLNN